jgi:hypothetical protein
MASFVNTTIKYAVGPAPTTLFAITGNSVTSQTALVKILAVLSDGTSFPGQAMDKSWTLVWNGSAFSSANVLYGTTTDTVLNWSISGTTASFIITPMITGSPPTPAPTGTISLSVALLPDSQAFTFKLQ